MTKTVDLKALLRQARQPNLGCNRHPRLACTVCGAYCVPCRESDVPRTRLQRSAVSVRVDLVDLSSGEPLSAEALWGDATQDATRRRRAVELRVRVGRVELSQPKGGVHFRYTVVGPNLVVTPPSSSGDVEPHEAAFVVT